MPASVVRVSHVSSIVVLKDTEMSMPVSVVRVSHVSSIVVLKDTEMSMPVSVVGESNVSILSLFWKIQKCLCRSVWWVKVMLVFHRCSGRYRNIYACQCGACQSC
ncbi:hypothetical protein CEXT_65981 [Caerostris extrusa]|uniref:Uncharacterized protein n=1 Tax=Caerostris extrusa TaxID=172846 RepID=A0AAV4SLL5_CAEEX|nr:hypothetical protein CEXT_65981 [Caerostris extrusa]